MQTGMSRRHRAVAVFEIVTPSLLFHTQLRQLQETLPAVLDGSETGIHDARIATRRIRELLPLVADEGRLGGTDAIRHRFRRLGRSLGRVRDADARVALLASLERRIPSAAPTLVLLRQEREHGRLKRMRKLIKRLERVDALRMVRTLESRNTSWPYLSAIRARKWRGDLRSIIGVRARAAEAAIDRATGVYFPNRTHATRIAIKRLRYAMEISHETGSVDLAAAIRELKKAQDILGDLHDRQDLLDHLARDASGAAPDLPEAGAQVALVQQVLDAEIRHLHCRYIDRRNRLVDVCHEARAVRSPIVPAPAAALAAAVALSSGAIVARRALKR
jgi:CHAD domain-containing protein